MRIGARTSWSSALALVGAAGFFVFFLGGCGANHDDSAPPSSGSYDGSNYTGTGGSTSIGAGKGGSTSKGGSSGYDPGDPGTTPGGTNVALGGAQDFGYFRALLDANTVPRPEDFEAAGFFAEHHTALPPPVCGNRICLQLMLGVMGNLATGSNCTMLQLGLNSPLAADPANRPPLSLSVVVDVSGSMVSGDKIGFVREGLGLLLDGMRDGDELALITYSDNAEIRFPLAEVSLQRAEIRSVIDGLVADGSTNLYEGLLTGYQEIFDNYDGERQNRVILLSDGQPTIGITDTPSILDMSKGYNSDGVGLTTVGLGTDFNADLMRGLALQADGNFYFLENSGAVNEVFTEELSYFTVPVAYDLSLQVHTGAEYTLGAAHGSPLWQDTSYGGLLEIPSVFLAHRESADDVTDDGGRRGGGSALLLEMMPNRIVADDSGLTDADIASVQVQFRDPTTDEIVTDEVVMNYPYAPWELLAEGYFDSADVPIVQKSFIMLNLFVGMQNACRTFHSEGGSSAATTQAVAELDNLLAAVNDYNEEVADTDITYDIEVVEQLRSVMIANEVQPPPPAPPPTNPWPAD